MRMMQAHTIITTHPNIKGSAAQLMGTQLSFEEN